MYTKYKISRQHTYIYIYIWQMLMKCNNYGQNVLYIFFYIMFMFNEHTFSIDLYKRKHNTQFIYINT